MTDIFNKYAPQFRGYHDLIPFRVREILLVSSPYDAFVLEEDGELSERILFEYMELDLRYIPRITHCTTPEKALDQLRAKNFDLVISMTRFFTMTALDFYNRAKSLHSDLPISFLALEGGDDELTAALREQEAEDRVFFWSGDARILLAIIKNAEDARNVAHDAAAGVQVVLVIEDSRRFYSLFLPLIYTEIFTQTRCHASDGINNLHRLLRTRARPKILLAETYEQGMRYLHDYRANLLGVICDVRFERAGRVDPDAGFRFAQRVKELVPDLPVLVQSSDHRSRKRAEDLGLCFIDKNSHDLGSNLRQFILSHFGFGEFIFRLPDGTECARATSINEMPRVLAHVPIESVEFHAVRNHFSIWLRARTEFELADELRSQTVSNFANMGEVREFLIEKFEEFIEQSQRGVVRDFLSVWSGTDPMFMKIGQGSLGGKARGLAFMNAVITNSNIATRFPRIKIRIPRTYVVGTQVFDDFIALNDLHRFVADGVLDQGVAESFCRARFPETASHDLASLVRNIRFPIAVRSSSLLEDCQARPFAGIYKTFMLPNNHFDPRVRLKQLEDAIKLVYASTFFRASKEYSRNTGYRVEDEKMGIIIQEIAGRRHGDIFYPTISGVARSYNFYPHGDMQPEDGVVSLALGLGKAVVEGEKVYHYCPAYPRVNPPYGSTAEFVANTQTAFYCLNMQNSDVAVTSDESFSLERLGISRAEKDGSLRYVASTIAEGGIIRDTAALRGPRLLRFAQLLKQEAYPLNDVVLKMLEMGRSSFGAPVEIEFALEIPGEHGADADFTFLQIRPMGIAHGYCEVDFSSIEDSQLVCKSTTAMGDGSYSEITDLVFVDPACFDVLHTQQIARELEKINDDLKAEGRRYILLGFGRWATSDPSLGVPVQWNQISQAQVFVESDRSDLWVEPSQGSHFFHNMVSLRLGYLFVRRGLTDEFIDWDWLVAQQVYQRTEHLRHLRFHEPLLVEVDGRTSLAVVYKPGNPRPFQDTHCR